MRRFHSIPITLACTLSLFALTACDQGTPSGSGGASGESSETSGGTTVTPATFKPKGEGPMLEIIAETPWVNDSNVTENRTHDFGTIWDTGKFIGAFKFQNVGSETLTIRQVKPGCGCTTLTLDKKVYEPGEEGEIEVVFSPLGKNRQTKGITVFSDSVTEPMVKLKITSFIQEFVKVEPRYMRIDPVRLGLGGRTSFLMKPVGEDYQIDEVLTTSAVGTGADWVTARLMEPGEMRITPTGQEVEVGEDEIAVEMVISPQTPWGGLYVAAEIKGSAIDPRSDERLEHTAKMNLATSVYGDLEASDNMLRANIVRPGAGFSASVTLTNRAGNAFTITNTTIEGALPPTMTINATPVGGSGSTSYKIEVTGQSGSYLGRIDGTAIIETNVPGEERLRIKIAGMIRNI